MKAVVENIRESTKELVLANPVETEIDDFRKREQREKENDMNRGKLSPKKGKLRSKKEELMVEKTNKGL